MTIHAQLSPQSPARESGHSTHGIDAGADGARGAGDQFAFLDPRTRRSAISAQAAPAGRYLSIEQGDGVRLIPLDRPITHIGRGLAADVRLEDPQVSRRHAIIAQRGDGVRVLDDRSFNGTILNGRPVTVAYLNDGDVVRLGRVVFHFVEIAPTTETAPIRRRIPLPVRAPGALLGGTG